MKRGAYFVFLATFALQVLHLSKGSDFCPDGGPKENAAFKNLMDYDKKIKDKLNFGIGCTKDMFKSVDGDTAESNVKLDNFERTDKVCYAVGNRKSLDVWVLSKTKEHSGAEPVQTKTAKACANKKPYQTLYLPQAQNKNTYMTLDPRKAELFFTTPLDGCDVFVLTNDKQPQQPIIVHANKNTMAKKKPEKDVVEQKGKDVNDIVQDNDGYEVKYRFVAKPETREAAKEIEQYQQHTKAKTIKYEGEVKSDVLSLSPSDQKFHFMGHFKGEEWKFIFKSGKGDIIWQNFECSIKEEQSANQGGGEGGGGGCPCTIL